jgi:hypothetical protein
MTTNILVLYVILSRVIVQDGMNIGHSNKTQHILFYEKRKMRIAVYNLQCTVCYCIIQ